MVGIGRYISINYKVQCDKVVDRVFGWITPMGSWGSGQISQFYTPYNVTRDMLYKSTISSQ